MAELTVEQKMELAIAKAKEQRKKAKDKAKLKLIENADYIEYLASVQDENDQVKHLTMVIEQLNRMKPIVTNDGTKYSVNIYPIAEYAFGPVMSRVLGIILGSSAMFTDKRQIEFKIITGIDYLSVTKARNAIGNPAYYSKGNLVNELPGDGTDLTTAITVIADALEIDLEYVKLVNKDNITRWFTASKTKAEKQYAEFKKTEIVDSANNFVLED